MRSPSGGNSAPRRSRRPSALSRASGWTSNLNGGGQATTVTMPALGESVTEGTVTRWLKQVGDTVEADEPLLEVSTDKVDTEIPAPAAGTLLEIKVAEDETASVGAELAVIGSKAGGGKPAPAPEKAEAPKQEERRRAKALAERLRAPDPRGRDNNQLREIHLCQPKT